MRESGGKDGPRAKKIVGNKVDLRGFVCRLYIFPWSSCRVGGHSCPWAPFSTTHLSFFDPAHWRLHEEKGGTIGATTLCIHLQKLGGITPTVRSKFLFFAFWQSQLFSSWMDGKMIVLCVKELRGVGGAFEPIRTLEGTPSNFPPALLLLSPKIGPVANS